MAQSLLQSIRSLRSTDVVKNLAEFHHSMMGYRAKGLRYDDLIPEENDLVKQALHRLPEKEHYGQWENNTSTNHQPPTPRASPLTFAS
ncbi:Cytochrome b-c1 complex subunit 7, partial [Thoreauomyces humboldtii]